ncbi:MAG: nuclear transport factor 2 family protein [Flavobacterium sp.]|nr:MAG: nuclear transport factor 2 family protein [Flavobacterium sp.]
MNDIKCRTQVQKLTPYLMTNKEIGIKILNEIFTLGNIHAIDKYCNEKYLQQSPSSINGHQCLTDMLTRNKKGKFRWLPDISIESNDLVISHSQIKGLRRPVMLLVIFRFEDNKIAEHWVWIINKFLPLRLRAKID